MASIIGSRSGGYIGHTPSIGTSGAGGVWGIRDVQVNSSSWPLVVSGLATPIEIFGTRDSDNGTAYAPTLSQYTSAGLTYPAMVSYAFSSGFHFFTVPAGTFTVTIKGAEGSGTQHGYGAHITATMVLDAPTRLVALVGTAGAGNYSGGGGTFLAIAGSRDSYSTATALLVAGGGGGGYSSLGTYSDAGDTSWSSTSQRTHNTDCSTYGGGMYDGGASFGNFFTVGVYNCTTSANAAQNFVSGGRGGIATDCGSGSANQGGFGGGGGACPAGGGGYYGGAPGGNSPANTGGGGGTSYRLTSGSARITAWSTVGTNGSGRTTNPGTSHGYLKIQNAA